MARKNVAGDKFERWRTMRAQRRAREQAGARRRKPQDVRPGGNAAAQFATPRAEPARAPEAPGEVQKHVPRNTHRPGSIAWSLLYDYRSER